jgi:protein TonB
MVLFRQQDAHECEFHWRKPAPNEYVSIERQPEMIEQALPAYPRWARKQEATGTVWVKVLVTPTGDVDEAQVGKSSGDAYLDNAAVLAAYRNKFKPALQDGKPVAIWVTYRVDFRIID